MIELLAPAKNKETAIAAIKSGADAIYIGAGAFGARKNAPNSIEDIKSVVDFAHKFWAKVYVTINTILTDSELKQAKDLIWDLYDIGVDAIIIQDMGFLQLAIDGELPSIPLHMSTQCDNRDVEKVKFFENVGVSRVILARELSMSKIKDICDSTNIEIEAFVHGALCVSYSGQCYLSHFIGGRSANRGECAQPCRKKYSLYTKSGKLIAKDKYLLCLKDFNTSKHLQALINTGILSLKIEGRLKDENYVKNVVAYYDKILDKNKRLSSGKVICDFEPNPEKTFNREFTDYFIEKRGECFNFLTPKSKGEYIGTVSEIGENWFSLANKVGKNNIKISPQDGLCFDIRGEIYGCLVNKVENNKIYPNKMPKILGASKVYRNIDSIFEKELSKSKIRRQIQVDITVNNAVVTAIDEDKNEVTLAISADEIANNPERMKQTFVEQINKTGDSDFYVENISIIGEIPFLPISQVNELRRTLFEKLMIERLKNYPKEIQKPLKYAQFPCLEKDYRANVHNKKAEEFYKNCGCKITEYSAESGSIPRELMRTKHCLKYAFDMCKSSENLVLVDEKGQKYPLKFDCANCEMVLLCPES